MKKFIGIMFGAWLALSACSDGAMRSPDGSVQAELSADGGQLTYRVVYKGLPVVGVSPLGLVIDKDTLGLNSTLKLTGRKSIDETYPTRGFHTRAVNRAEEYTYRVNSAGGEFDLICRLYDDGFAFRYSVPGEGIRMLDDELSGFSVPAGIPVWYLERESDWKLKTYAGEWLRTRSDSLCSISATGPVQAPVLLYELPGDRYMTITEAALYDYSGMRLRAFPDASLRVDFTESGGFPIDGRILTPWRVIGLNDNLNGLVNSDLITNLNPAPDAELFADTGWIVPGRSVWSWWSESPGFMTLPYERKFIDDAVELGYEYTILDEGWERWRDKWNDLKAICDYARERNVGVWVWKHSDQLIDESDDYATMRHFLDSVKLAGAVGLKIDFMNGESKRVIDFDIRALQLCAERKLLVDFHGCQKPSGEYRTYPNELTREGIRGLELNKMDQHLPATHNVALVFTRCILNNADYTPVGFSNPGTTSWAHQLATAYAFTSPLVVVAEHPDYLLRNAATAPALPLIKALPAVWDETRILPGSSVAGRAIMARRSGDTWYLTVLNGNRAETISVDTGFLPAGKWSLYAVTDVPEMQRSMAAEADTISAGDKLNIRLNCEGGYVAQLTPLP